MTTAAALIIVSDKGHSINRSNGGDGDEYDNGANRNNIATQVK